MDIDPSDCDSVLYKVNKVATLHMKVEAYTYQTTLVYNLINSTKLYKKIWYHLFRPMKTRVKFLLTELRLLGQVVLSKTEFSQSKETFGFVPT